MGFVPVNCSNWTAASGQSVHHTAASAAFMPSKAFAPMRPETSCPSTVMAYVPSWPQHSITVAATSTPGMRRTRSRPLNPTAWARRWHGAW